MIDTEGDRSPADVFISQSPGAVGFLDAQGRLGRCRTTCSSLVAEGNHAGDGTGSACPAGCGCSSTTPTSCAEAELPDSVLDLTGPDYEGQVASLRPTARSMDFVTAMRTELGDDAASEWLTGMADNDARPYPNNNAIVEAVGRGEIAMGLVNHYYNVRAKPRTRRSSRRTTSSLTRATSARCSS